MGHTFSLGPNNTEEVIYNPNQQNIATKYMKMFNKGRFLNMMEGPNDAS